jgi:hypothetical protein
VQLQIVFQNAWMTKETSQPVSKIMDRGSLFLGKVPSLETHFCERYSLMDVRSIWYIEWFTPSVRRKLPLHCVFSRTVLSTSDTSIAISTL